MPVFKNIRQPYHWIGVVSLLLVLIGGAVVAANAQSQTCRDIGNITVCGDQLTELTANGGGFKLVGNVKVGPKGAAPVVQVRNTGSVFTAPAIGSVTT